MVRPTEGKRIVDEGTIRTNLYVGFISYWMIKNKTKIVLGPRNQNQDREMKYKKKRIANNIQFKINIFLIMCNLKCRI